MNKPVILCVDDEKVVLTSLKEQLKGFMSAYDIEIAESGQEALEIVAELKDDRMELPLVISDYVMPNMTGDALLKEVHQIQPQTVKILLTGQATTEGVANAVNYANLYRYIAKPWEREDLCLTINEAVKSYYKDRQLEEQNERLKEMNRELVEMTDSFVETMVVALDVRDTTTAGHSKRLAGYAVKFAEAVSAADYGKYKDLHFSQEQLKELRYAALLHDIGKIGIPESILQKQFRLTLEQQNEIKYRFNYHKKCLELKGLYGSLSDDEARLLENLDAYFNFIVNVSRKAFVTEEDEATVRSIAKIEYTDIDDKPQKLLKDFEVESLIIRRGNLTAEERRIVNAHVDHTYHLLKGIPWPKTLRLVPDIAFGHHERMDGTGYSKGLKGDAIPVQSRILAILDIFEALTALDRPYKPPMSIENAIKILDEEVEAGHLDRELYNIFITEKVYELYRSELI